MPRGEFVPVMRITLSFTRLANGFISVIERKDRGCLRCAGVGGDVRNEGNAIEVAGGSRWVLEFFAQNGLLLFRNGGHDGI